MNILIGLLSIVLVFSSVVLLEKHFGKNGLYVWIGIATVTANIVVCKTINILGLTSAVGNVMFTSVFLASDILNEKYGKKDAQRAILLGTLSSVIFMIATQLTLLYIPDQSDVAHGAMATLFTLNLRTTIASVVLYLASNVAGVHLYDYLKNKCPVLFRNNVVMIICNCTENFLFAFFAFAGIMDMMTILSIALTGSLIELIVTLLATPFMYLTTRRK